jgi:hypothetical protein
MITSSIKPPIYPDIRPSVVPMNKPADTDARAIISDILDPCMILLSRSRPKLSAPNMYVVEPPSAQIGGKFLARSEDSSGSCGAIKSANIAQMTINRIMKIGISGHLRIK